MTAVTRRAAIGAILVGGASLLAACGSVSPDAPGTAGGAAPAAPAAAPNAMGGGALPVEVVGSAGAALPAAVPTHRASASPPTATPETLARGTAGSPTAAVPTATATERIVPTATPVPPTATPYPTATPIPYSAARLTNVLGQSVTSYAGSVPPRVHNVQLATRLINGTKIAPGEVFSFDAAVGDQTEAHGFQVAWGIVDNNGTAETVQADAGGICQVATTVFQAAYWAGLPIVRRYHHLYWIAHYGQPPYGMTGLDATVDFPPVDLQFRNPTSDWIRLEATYDATTVRVRLLGIDPGWKVTVGKPSIDNFVKVDRATVRREDPTMPSGRQIWVESAQDGFDVTIERLVTRGSELIDRYVFTNHYLPAHNVLVVGTQGGLPPSATPGPEGSPAPASPTATGAISPTVVPTTPSPSAVAQVRVPSVIGLPEAQARQVIAGASLRNTYANYQGPGDVPPAALAGVPVGMVLSQVPAPGTLVAAGSAVYLAVRKA